MPFKYCLNICLVQVNMYSNLPYGDVGRVINSFTGLYHPDAIKWQRDFRSELYMSRESELPFLSQLSDTVYLIAIKHINRKYDHAIRLPDYRRIIPLTNILPYVERKVVIKGGVPHSWYPMLGLRRIMRVFSGTVVGTNNYIVENPDPLPWEDKV